MRSFKVFLASAVALLALALAGNAQAAHSATVGWTPSPTTGLSAYNVYRAPCNGTITNNVCSNEGTFAKIGSTVNGTTNTYTDSTVSAGLSYSYYATAQCPVVAGCSVGVSGESAPSNHYAVQVPNDSPLPPSGLTITSAAFNSNGSNGTLNAQWQDTPSVPTRYTLTANKTTVAAGVQTNSIGLYSLVWNGKVTPGSTLVLKVCDAAGYCQSTTL